MATATVFTAGGVVIFVLCANGVLPWGDGFARATDVEKTNKALERIIEQQHEARVEALDSGIFNLRSRQCLAENEGNATQLITRRLRDKMDEYYNLTHREYPLPDCSEMRR